MADEAINGSSPRLRFTLTIEFDPETHGSGYGITMDDRFSHAVIVNTLEKVKQRIINEQLMTEARQLAAADAQKIQVAKDVPKRRF